MSDTFTLEHAPDTALHALFAPNISLAPADWKDADNWLFECFALHMQTRTCRTCGSVQHTSEAFKVFLRKNEGNHAHFSKRLIPASEIPLTLTVVTFKLPDKEVPICHNCISSRPAGTERILVTDENEWKAAISRSNIAREQARTSSKERETKVFAPLASLL